LGSTWVWRGGSGVARDLSVDETVSALESQIATLTASPASTPSAAEADAAREVAYLAAFEWRIDTALDAFDVWDSVYGDDDDWYNANWRMGLDAAAGSMPILIPPFDDVTPPDRYAQIHAELILARTAVLDAFASASGAIDANDRPAFNLSVEAIATSRRNLVVLRDDFRALGGASTVNQPEMSDQHQLTGYIDLFDLDGRWRNTGPCSGDGGFSDLYVGADVVVLNENGTIIANGAVTDSDAQSTVVCRLEFEVNDVPKAKFYTIEVGGRSGPTYSFDDLEESGWVVGLNIGT